MRNVQKISAVALGMLAGFAINKYATAENFAKLKGKIKETYDDLSKKFEEATEPKVEYVDDEITVDESLMTQAMGIQEDAEPVEDIVFIGTISVKKISDAHKIVGVALGNILDSPGYITAESVINMIQEIDPNYVVPRYAYYILEKYGWVDPSDFDIRYDKETDKYIITDVAPVRLYTNEEKANEDKNTEPDTGSAEDTNVM